MKLPACDSKLQVWSCGGGRQSVAIAILILQGRLPKPDVSVIADTGRETKTTWQYLDEILNPAFKKIGLEIARVKASEWSYYHKTGHELFNAQGTLSIPAYTNLSGEISKLPGFCSSAWKQEPIDRWLRSQGIKKNQAVKWLGYGKNEQVRWVRAMDSPDFKRGLLRLPLVHDVPMNLGECIHLITKYGFPEPPKSRCFDCPNQTADEWMSLEPDEFALAVQRDKDIRERDPNAFLHKSCVPLDQVDFKAEDDLFNRPCDTGGCFT